MKLQGEKLWNISTVQWALGICSILVFLLVNKAKVNYAESDARFSLLASQSLLENGSFRLDSYIHSFDLAKENDGNFWMVAAQGKERHFYYDYPVGTPIFSLPFVAIARAVGMNMVRGSDDAWLQIQMASGLAVLIFLLLFRMARRVLGEGSAMAFALLIWAGSSLSSTLGTALWSQGFQTAFILLALDEILALHLGQRQAVRGTWLGFLLFSAYLCRPTSLILGLLILAYLAWQDRKAMLMAFVTIAGFALVFVLWSWAEFEAWSPRYYNPATWRKDPETWAHLMPIWFGPARGFFSFSPVFLLPFLGFFFASFRKNALTWLVVIWWLGLSWTVINSQAPWGGWCFGPRFFTELVPGFALLLLLLAHTGRLWFPQRKIRLQIAFVLLSAFGLWVNLYQGLYNSATKDWNDQPNIDQAWKARRSDWSDPQFFALDFKNKRRDKLLRLSERMACEMRSLPDGSAILYGQPDPDLADIFPLWNAENHFGRGFRCFNSTFAWHHSGEPEAFVYLPQAEYFSSLGYLELRPADLGSKENLAAFLKRNAQHAVYISAKDEASYAISDESKAYLRSLGSRIDSLKMRDSYFAVLKGGQLLKEEMGQRPLSYFEQGKLELQSQGLFVGNASSIKVNGLEYSPNLRGMNVLVMDSLGKVQELANFDMHAADVSRSLWLSCGIKRQ